MQEVWQSSWHHTEYGAGHFDTLARKNMGDWLGWSFLVGSIMCQLGLRALQALIALLWG